MKKKPGKLTPAQLAWIDALAERDALEFLKEQGDMPVSMQRLRNGLGWEFLDEEESDGIIRSIDLEGAKYRAAQHEIDVAKILSDSYSPPDEWAWFIVFELRKYEILHSRGWSPAVFLALNLAAEHELPAPRWASDACMLRSTDGCRLTLKHLTKQSA